MNTPDPAALAVEATYWQHVIADVIALNEQLHEQGDDLASTIVALCTLAIAPAAAVRELQGDALGHASSAMRRILVMQDALKRLLELTDGRARMLAGEHGIDLPEPELGDDQPAGES